MRPKYRILALCCASQQRAVSFAAGTHPFVSPPATHETFQLGRILQTRGPFDLLYLSLHGYPTIPFLFGDRGAPAVSIDDFQDLDLSHTVVFAASCHFTETPFPAAILKCNPRLLIGGPGPNYTRPQTVVGANLLGYLFRFALRLGQPPHLAFIIAKAGLHARTIKLKHRKARLPDSSQGAEYISQHLRLAEDIFANLDALKFQSIKYPTLSTTPPLSTNSPLSTQSGEGGRGGEVEGEVRRKEHHAPT